MPNLNEKQTLIFTNAPTVQEFALRAVNTTEHFVFTPATSNANIKAGIEALEAYAGRTATVSGSLTGTDSKSGTKTIDFDGTVNVPPLEVLQSESEALTITNATTPGTWRGATITPGDSEATVQAALRGTGGNNANVIVKGSSTAVGAVTNQATGGAAATPGGNAGPVDTPALLWDNNDGTNLGLGEGQYADYIFGGSTTRTINQWGFRVNDALLQNGVTVVAAKLYGLDGLGGATLLDTQTGITQTLVGGFCTTKFTIPTTAAWRGFRIEITDGSGTAGDAVGFARMFLELVENGNGAYTAYFPYSVGNITAGVVSGTGYSRANVTQGATVVASVIVPETVIEGGPATFNWVTTDTEGEAVQNPDGPTETGWTALLHVAAVRDDNATIECVIEQSTTGDFGGEETEVCTFDVTSEVGVQIIESDNDDDALAEYVRAVFTIADGANPGFAVLPIIARTKRQAVT